jgi:hypothetical protein
MGTMKGEAAIFIVAKGYHMGSKWFEETFNRLPGCAFMFEFEHCLRHAGRQTVQQAPLSGSVLAPPNYTLRFLQHGCRCSWSCAPDETCQGTNHGNRSDSSSSSGQHAHHSMLETAVPLASTHGSHCRAVGVSFGALGPTYISHLQALIRLEPRVAVVVHVRSNHIKHGLSFLRTSCQGEKNHVVGATSAPLAKHTARMYVPAPLLVLRALLAARAQDKVLRDANEIRGERKLAYVVRYEAMQRDIGAEMGALLRALGAPASHANPPQSAVALVKAGSDFAGDMLTNMAQLEAQLLSLPCLLSMLVARGPVAFELRACERELAQLPAGLKAAMNAERSNRSMIKVALFPRECEGQSHIAISDSLSGRESRSNSELTT